VSEEYNLQVSGQVLGDLVVVRGATAEDLAANLRGLAEQADDIVTAWADFKTAAVAKGVFTGNAVGGNKGGKAAASTAASSNGGPPRCKHGDMKDLSDKNYKSTHYCPAPRGEEQCKPVNLRGSHGAS
jgi:hypothetical protein